LSKVESPLLVLQLKSGLSSIKILFCQHYQESFLSSGLREDPFERHFCRKWS